MKWNIPGSKVQLIPLSEETFINISLGNNKFSANISCRDIDKITINLLNFISTFH